MSTGELNDNDIFPFTTVQVWMEKSESVGTPNTRCQLQYVLFSFFLCPKTEIKRIRIWKIKFEPISQSSIKHSLSH